MPDAAAVSDQVRQALTDRHYLLVARAAEVCAARLLYDLEPSLIAAYNRFLDKAVKKDPQCTAKGAIARALVALDCQDSDFYNAGLSYRQHEPVWGGSVDTAVDLRATCATGLVATPSPRALIALVELLADPEPRARTGAVRAIACTEPLAAEAVLRCKALTGDPEPEVIGECLSALLQVEPDDSPAFVARYLDDADPAIRELAALALGESRLDPGLDLLKARWDREPLKGDAERTLLRAAVLHRSEAAFDWLLSVVAGGDRASAALVVQELAVYRANTRLRDRLGEIVARRADEPLQERFASAWEEGGGSSS
ncbi:MAG: HEAT repeat domain-containing protein [Pseudomonadota bacterium]|nr:HEAT repeat domain-containing protein [Pseudomonadota bacterium]